MDNPLMANVDRNLRKAAVLLRSLDAETATVMLGQLSAEEAATIRAAMRAVGQVEANEQADVMAELRGARPEKQSTFGNNGVELALSSAFANERQHVASHGTVENTVATNKQFEFLESAPIHALVPHLAREHAQTIAVVLSHLAPERAAAILAALPQKAQAETVERLSTLGDTDPECVKVLMSELETWATQRRVSRGNGKHRDTMTAILAAADTKSRGQILSNMRDHKAALSAQFAPRQPERSTSKAPVAEARAGMPVTRPVMNRIEKAATTIAPVAQPHLSRIAFDDLAELDSRTLSAILRLVDANVLALALAGSRDELVDRICDQMPKRTARGFRRELRRLGPTRLSDVEAAQHAVAQIAARQIAEHRPKFATPLA
jgi:flagellar motor switch protein FliG